MKNDCVHEKKEATWDAEGASNEHTRQLNAWSVVESRRFSGEKFFGSCCMIRHGIVGLALFKLSSGNGFAGQGNPLAILVPA